MRSASRVFVPAFDDSWWNLWHVGAEIDQFPIGFGFWIFQFTKSPSQLPKIRPIANLLSSKLLRWKLENPKISQLPKILPIHPKISQFPIPSPKIASEPAILEAIERFLAINHDMVKVLQIANALQSNALAKLLPTSSAPDFRPA